MLSILSPQEILYYDEFSKPISCWYFIRLFLLAEKKDLRTHSQRSHHGIKGHVSKLIPKRLINPESPKSELSSTQSISIYNVLLVEEQTE